MELKLYKGYMMCFCCLLLIVPYGIETAFIRDYCHDRITLLIVPYGIETRCAYRCCDGYIWLLIVPYGIETSFFAVS